MAQDAQQVWNPVEDFKTKYPSSGYSDQEIYKNLSNPSMFKSAFPNYAHLGDDEIKQGLGQFASKYAPSGPPKGPSLPIPAGLQPPDQFHTRDLSTDIQQANTPGILGGSSGNISDPGIQKDMSDSGDTKPHNKRGFGLQVLDNLLGVSGGPEGNQHDQQLEAQNASGVERAGHIPVIGDHIVTGAKAVDSFGKGHVSEGLGYTGATMLPLFGPMAAGAGEKLGQGDVKGSLADVTAGAALPKALEFLGPKYGTSNGKSPQSAKVTSPAQERAFNAVSPDNAEIGVDSIAPEYRNAAAKDAQANPANPVTSRLVGATKKLSLPSGKAGVEKSVKLAQDAITEHNDVVQSVKAPFGDQPVDNTSAAQAALTRITPEMENTAKTDPKVANEIAALKDIATRAQGANTIDLADQLRHTWNDELAPDYGKTEIKQDVAPSVTQAKRDAVNALRSNFYDRLADLSGRQDIRGLAQREGQLIETKAGMTKTGNAALRSPANSKNFIGRAMAGDARSEGGVSSVTPNKASALLLPLNLIRAGMNPDFGTPVGDFLTNVKKATSNLGVPENLRPFVDSRPPTLTGQQTSLLPSPGPLFDVQQSPNTTHPSSPAIPHGAEDLLRPGTGTATGTHSPYKPGQPVATAVTPQDRAAMEGAEFGGFKIGSDETPAYGRTRRPLVTEEHPEIDAVPDFIKQLFAPKNGPKQLPPASSIQLGPSSLEGSVTKPAVGADDRGAGLAARKGGSVIPERGKGFVTNEAAERRSLPRSTQAQLLTSEANEIRRSIQDSASPEEKRYNEQRLAMKQDEITKLSSGDLPEAHGAASASAPVGQSDIPAPVRDALGLTRDRATNGVRTDQGSTRLPGVKETMAKTNDTYTKVETYARTQSTIGLTALKEKFGFSTPEAVSMLDQLESKGVVKPASGSGPRRVAQKTKAQGQ